MDGARFIYQNRSDAGFYDASTQQMRGGPDKVIVYLDGVLCAMDREAKIIIPVSRWKLAEIGLACFMAALKVKGAPRPRETVLLPEPITEALPPDPEALPGAVPEATHQNSSEARWANLIQEMRDLSR
jgi:hypothetical protein